ncbi:MAG: amino acid adenylation domain-containing protein, partial [Blastocatellia bacterium]
MNQLPIGVVGEALIGGSGLARGYLNRSDLTAERFLPDPFGTSSGSRVYRSGDIARNLPGAESDYLGRRDQQVKIRGFRIELGEIEFVLVGHSSIDAAKVIAESDSSEHSKPANPRLIAYVIPAEGLEFAEAEVRTFLKTKLPDYMVPASIVSVTHFPLTPHGKLDTRRLPSPQPDAAAKSTDYEPPQDEKETLLAEIWSDVLGVDRVGATDNFFDIGGDSIRAIQVRARAEQAGIGFSIQQLFAGPTIRRLASAELPSHEQQFASRPFGLISKSDKERLPDDVEDAYPLSSLQMGMLFHSLYDQSSTIYHNVNSMRLKGNLNVEALRQAIAEVVKRHAVLRTSFDLAGFSEPIQLVHREIETPLTVHDLCGFCADEQSAMISSFFTAQRENKFDLLTAPLIRFNVHLLRDDESQFSWTEHHAILDGWSVASMITEIVSVYHEINQTGAPASRRRPDVTFRDFIALELDAIQSEECRNFWERKLESFSTDAQAKPAGKSQAGVIRRLETVERVLDESQLKSIKDFASAAGVPLKSALLAVHFRVQALLTGSSRVVARIVSNGRPEEQGADEILGLFLNTLPLPLELSGLTLSDLARSVFQIEREALPYRRYPLARIERFSGAQTGLDSLFTFVHFHVVEHLPQDTGLEVIDMTSAIETNFGLEVEFILEESLHRLRQVIKYDTSEFSGESFGGIADYYTRAIQQMIALSDGRIETLTLLSEREVEQLVYSFNNSRVERAGSTVLDLFNDRVSVAPDCIALSFENEVLTFQGLDALATRLAGRLRSMTTTREPVVAVCLERSLEMATAVLGVLKSGAPYLPLDPAYQSERLAFMLRDSHADVVITSEATASSLPVDGHSVVIIEDLLARSQSDLNGADAGIINPPLPDSAAYIIYTSGSTGQPKGVVMTHRALFNIVSWQLERFGGERPSPTLQFAPLSFDVAIQEIMSAWCSGAPLAMIADELRRDSRMLLSFLRDTSIGRVFMPFIAVQQLADAFEPSQPVPTALRHVITAGEQLRITPQIKRLFEMIPECRFENQYGPTESHVTTAYRLPHDPENWDELPPIGRPVSNTQINIVSEWLQAVPIGVPGELFIAGDCLARGYLYRPELTSERFIPNAFSREPGARVYRTGDLARYRPEGQVEFLGRMDRQTKVRGFRVEIGEIEAAIDGDPSIAQCAVDVREDDRGQKRLVAYVVAAQGASASIPALKKSIGAKLPEYMVPSLFVALGSMPLTPSGKINRRALPSPDFSVDTLEPESDYTAPSNMLEATLAGIWEEVLSIGQVGTNEDFFDAGGNSLYATQVISRVRKRLAIDLPVRLSFEARTIAKLAAEIALLPRDGTPDITTPRSLPAVIPLSPAQQRLWLVDRLAPGTAAYSMPMAVWLKRGLSHKPLEDALNEIVRRHGVLRTTFVTHRDIPSQLVGDYRQSTLKTVDLTSLPETEAHDVALGLARQEAGHPFGLEKGPPFRAVLIKAAAAELLFVVNMHHIVSDGWSLNVLTHEMTSLYEAWLGGRPSTLEELSIQYVDYAVVQREHLTGRPLETGLRYWKRQLAGAPPEMSLPVDRPRPQNPSYRGASRSFTANSAVTAAIIDVARQEGTTEFVALLASFAALLSRYSCENDLLIGTPVSGRNLVETEPLIGFFVNSLPLRIKVSAETTFQQLLRQTRETVFSATAHQDIPFEMIVDEMQPDRFEGRSPIFQVMFTLDNVTGAQAAIQGVEMDFVDVASDTSKFDLTLALTELDGCLRGAFQFSPDLFDGTTV